MKQLYYRLPSSRSFAKLLSVLAFAALGFIYSSAAYASVVLHGIDGGTTAGDGKFIWDKSCRDTVSKATVGCTSAPSIGYLYKGPDSTGKYIRTGTCWNKLTNLNVACSTATGFISSSFSHTGIKIEGGDVSVTLGEINASEQLMTVLPGAPGIPAKAIIDVPDVIVQGFDVNNGNADLGSGHFKYHVEYTIPLATSDPNKGHGNDCSKCDPNNPSKKGSSCTGCSVNQTCTNLSATESQFTVKAFCQQGVVVTGYLTWIDPNPGQSGDTPPAFTNCPNDSTTCTLRLGGLPLTTNGTVDDTLCAAIFPGVNVLGDTTKHLDLKQLLLFQQNYDGQCKSTTLADFGLEDPQGAKAGLHRECNSDYGKDNGFVAKNPSFLDGEGFDNVFRGCVVATNTDGSPAYHAATGAETARSREVTAEVSPESINLKCNVDPKTGQINDNGIATAKICGSAEFDVRNNIAGLLNAGKIGTDAPVLTPSGTGDIVSAKPKSWSIATDSTGACADPLYEDLTLTYATCTQAFDGLAQVIAKRNPDIVDGGIVTLTLQGKESGGGIPVIIQGTDTAKVVKTQ